MRSCSLTYKPIVHVRCFLPLLLPRGCPRRSSRPYIRKKATLVLYKLYLAYPQGLRLTFDNLKRRLTDEVSLVDTGKDQRYVRGD